ncbi:LRP chaperone MESD-like [Dreissena polymorpha]|uniref:LDLR chaperone MESD n=1 Tax=Dreissena polymorpha TaxID=45954 RepID=A0A9D4RND2_DREPO|nr:LRP chaperone MESD-like [Dreissena polymorpha]KAH3875326.1 hypothetical protein DPMN_038589 [Dreissena polymorpha]
MACPTFTLKIFIYLFILFSICNILNCKKSKEKEPVKGKKKDIRDFNDADIEKLYDEWEEGDEDQLEPDELPEWKRDPPQVDMSQLNMQDPEGMLKATKKGRTLMMFATVSGNPSQPETEKITQIWQGSLFNANMETQRYVVGDNRVIFMLKDGATAWEIKDFLVQQDRCEEVTIEGKSYPGKGASGKGDNKKEKTKSKNAKETDNKPKDKKDKTSQKSKKEEEITDNNTSRKKNTEL